MFELVLLCLGVDLFVFVFVRSGLCRCFVCVGVLDCVGVLVCVCVLF